MSRLYEVLNKGGHLLIIDFDKNEQIDDNIKNIIDAYKIAYNIIISNKSDLKLKTLEPALKKV